MVHSTIAGMEHPHMTILQGDRAQKIGICVFTDVY